MEKLIKIENVIGKIKNDLQSDNDVKQHSAAIAIKVLVNFLSNRNQFVQQCNDELEHINQLKK